MTPQSRLTAAALRFAGDEQGVITAWSLFLTVTICAIGAAAVDVTHLYAARTQLQVAADLGAHTALYTRRYGNHSGGIPYPLTDDEARTATIAAVGFGMPPEIYEQPVVQNSTIVLGTLDPVTGTVVLFSPLDDTTPVEDPDSAQVTTYRATAGGNAVSTFLFRLMGINTMDVATTAVFTLGPAECDSDQGFFSEGTIDITSGNTFHPGFCIAGDEFHVQNGNWFRPGVATTIPNAAALNTPNSDQYEQNPGLMQSLDFDTIDLSTTLNLIETSNAALGNFADHAYAAGLLTTDPWDNLVNSSATTTPFTVGGNGQSLVDSFSPDIPDSNRNSELASNAIHVITCDDPDRGITLRQQNGSGNTFSNMIIVTNCAVTFDGEIKLENFLLSTSFEDKNSHSIRVPSSNPGPTFGTDDSCDPGGGAALITRGSFDAAAKANYYGAVIRTGDDDLKGNNGTGVDGDVNFQSGAYGEGVSILAGGNITTQAGIEMKVCGPAANTLPTNVPLQLYR